MSGITLIKVFNCLHDPLQLAVGESLAPAMGRQLLISTLKMWTPLITLAAFLQLSKVMLIANLAFRKYEQTIK